MDNVHKIMISQSDLKSACESVEAFQQNLEADLENLSENLDRELENLQLQVKTSILSTFLVRKSYLSTPFPVGTNGR